MLRYRHRLLEPGNTQDVLHELPTIRCQQSHRNKGGSWREISTRWFLKKSPGETHHREWVLHEEAHRSGRGSEISSMPWNVPLPPTQTYGKQFFWWKRKQKKKTQANHVQSLVRCLTYLHICNTNGGQSPLNYPSQDFSWTLVRDDSAALLPALRPSPPQAGYLARNWSLNNYSFC